MRSAQPLVDRMVLLDADEWIDAATPPEALRSFIIGPTAGRLGLPGQHL